VEFLPVYVPSPEEQRNPKLFANNVKKKMAEALSVPSTEHNFDDVMLMQEATKLKLPPAGKSHR
jgi:lysophosphatidylcholine acyltransferase/lyso-PAF acetyltransferase